MTIQKERNRATEDKHFKIEDTDFGHPHVKTAKSFNEPVDLANVGVGGIIHHAKAKDNMAGGYSISGDLNEDVLTDDPLGEGASLAEENLTDEDDKGGEAQLETT